MKSTERMANLIIPSYHAIKTGHGFKTKAELATMIEEQTGIEKLAQATEALIEFAEWAEANFDEDVTPINYADVRPSLDRGIVLIAQAHAAVRYYRGDDDAD